MKNKTKPTIDKIETIPSGDRNSSSPIKNKKMKKKVFKIHDEIILKTVFK